MIIREGREEEIGTLQKSLVCYPHGITRTKIRPPAISTCSRFFRPELDALIKAKVAEADADPRPYVPIKKAFKRIRANIAGNG